MPRPRERELPVLEPNLQVSFYHKLQTIRGRHLREALQQALGDLPLELLDAELRDLAPETALRKLATQGLRGEVFFPVPCLLKAGPNLLGYYRLLYGLSQKEFYSSKTFGRFKRLEAEGQLGSVRPEEMQALCRSLVGTAVKLVQVIDELTVATVNELQLLTLGAQLRGSENTRVGKRATKEVFDIIRQLVGPYLVEETARTLVLRNDAGRSVLVEFAADPDI